MGNIMEYISENLNKSIQYSEYIAENVDTNIAYFEYISENLNKSIQYSEYSTETEEMKQKRLIQKREDTIKEIIDMLDGK